MVALRLTRWSVFLALLGVLIGTVPAVRAAPACAVGTAGVTQRVAIGETGRSMLIHIPNASAPAPLLFVLHGSGGSGAAILESSGLEATSDRHGFILAAPDAGIPHERGFVWNIPNIPTVAGKIPGPEAADDVAFLTAAIDWLAAQGCVDRSRVYATGLSGGGRMTSWLGCVAADRFAAIAPVVGLRAGNPLARDPARPDPATCRPSRAVPVIAFAGDRDTTNPIEGGGAGYWQYTMAAAEKRWAELNGCRAPLAVRDMGAVVYEERYSRCRAGAEVVGRITRGGGHAWVADNEALWEFLSRYRRR